MHDRANSGSYRLDRASAWPARGRVSVLALLASAAVLLAGAGSSGDGSGHAVAAVLFCCP